MTAHVVYYGPVAAGGNCLETVELGLLKLWPLGTYMPPPNSIISTLSRYMHEKSFRETRKGANVTDDIKEPSAASPHLSVQQVPSQMPGEGFFHER